MRVKQNKCMFKYIKTIKRHVSIGYDAFMESKRYYHGGCNHVE